MKTPSYNIAAKPMRNRRETLRNIFPREMVLRPIAKVSRQCQETRLTLDYQGLAPGAVGVSSVSRQSGESSRLSNPVIPGKIPGKNGFPAGQQTVFPANGGGNSQQAAKISQQKRREDNRFSRMADKFPGNN